MAELKGIKANLLPLAMGLALLTVGGATLPGAAVAQPADSVQSVIDQMGRDGLPIVNQKRGEYNAYAQKAKSKKVNIAFSGDLGGFSEYGRSSYTAEDMMPLLPSAFLDDVNRKILNEYYRGYYEWFAGFMPPALYYGLYDDYYRNIFISYDRDIFVYGLPLWVGELFITQRNLSLTGESLSGLSAQIDKLKPQLDTVLREADAFISKGPTETPSKWKFWKKTKEWNKGAWSTIRSKYDTLMRQWQRLLQGMSDSVNAKAVAGFQSAVQWNSGMVTRVGTFYDWSRFDRTLTTNLPSGFQEAINRRLAKAYFRGAYDRKYDRQAQSGTGNGYSYSYSNPYGTGDGNIYTGGRWGTGNGYGGTGSYNGRGRTPIGTGDGNSSGSGSGTGSGSGSGTGTGSGPDWGGLNGSGSGTGSGSGSGRTGTGSGSGSSSSGSGSGSGSSSSGTGTGSGSGSRSSGTGTGSGSGSRSSGTGTGSGSGSSSSGTGTGSGN